jgi:DNA-directed RNA polymerase specialized sigma24 family protein
VGGALPVVVVEGREDMAVMLAKHGRLLREYARHYLGEKSATDDEVEEAVDRVIDSLLAEERPSHPHGLGVATHALWRECQHVLRLRGRRVAPADPRLGPLTGPVARVLERLGPKSRMTIIRAAQGWTAEEQARADNIAVESVHLRMHRARKRALALLKERGHSVSATLFLLPHRVGVGRRRATAWLQRRASLVGWPLGSDPLTQLAVVAALAVTGLGTTASTLASARVPAPTHDARGHASASTPPAVPPPVALARAEAPVVPTIVAHGPSPSPTPGGMLPALLGGGFSPGSETPEDAQLMTAAAPADYAATHTIVALGIGHSCACPVLFQSTDGGANWTASQAAAPVGADQVALPPTYPADPRIFVGTKAQSGASDYLVPRFGDMATPLPGPPGDLALAAGFDHGDNRLFIAAQGAVVSLAVDATPPQLVPVLALNPQWVGTASVATPAADMGAAVMVLAPPGTLAVGDPLSGETQATAVFACGGGTSCTRRGTPPSQALVLSASPSDTVSAASWAQGIAVSGDGGASFRTPVMPSAVTTVPSVAASGGRVWAVIQRGATADVIWASAAGSPWVDVTAADGALGHSLALVAVPDGRVLDLLSGRGLRCTADGGLTWGSRCP